MVEGCGREIQIGETYHWLNRRDEWIRVVRSKDDGYPRHCAGVKMPGAEYYTGKGRLCRDCWIRLGHIW